MSSLAEFEVGGRDCMDPQGLHVLMYAFQGGLNSKGKNRRAMKRDWKETRTNGELSDAPPSAI